MELAQLCETQEGMQITRLGLVLEGKNVIKGLIGSSDNLEAD